METRFGALNFLCKLQIVIGALVIVGGFYFMFFVLAVYDPQGAPAPELPGWLEFSITVGLFFAGLQIIAMAQVYQCLMQIEINTRPVAELRSAAASQPAPPLPEPPRPLEPRTDQPSFSLTGEPR
jgi:hypothetical protein